MSGVFDNPALVGFYALGAVAIFASLRVIIHANPVHAILSMIVSLLAVAGIFFILGAPFAGALEVIVYAGAILVLFVFVIMMLNLGIINDSREERWLSANVWAVPTGLTIIIAVVLYAMIDFGAAGHAMGDTAMMAGATVDAKAVGTSMFSQYILLVEVAAMLLLAALVAAYHLGKKALDDENVSHASQQFEGRHNLVEYEDDSLTNAAKMAKPYEYEPVDPASYTNKSAANKNKRTAEPKGKSHTISEDAGKESR